VNKIPVKKARDALSSLEIMGELKKTKTDKITGII
jgi:hypothetical protein